MSVTRPPPRANSSRVDDTKASEREDRKKIQKEKRMDLASKKRRENHRKNIARELNRDAASIDSDDERKWVSKMIEDVNAEEKRRQGLSPAERRQEDIQVSAKALESLVKEDVGPYPSRPYAVFLLQMAPESRSGAKCELPHCVRRILPGDYRIKLDGGHWSEYPSGKFPNSPYHFLEAETEYCDRLLSRRVL